MIKQFIKEFIVAAAVCGTFVLHFSPHMTHKILLATVWIIGVKNDKRL